MAYELTGKVKLIKEAQTLGSGFTKQEVVIVDESGKFSQEINFEFVQEKVSLLDGVGVGAEVTVTFDIRGHEYNGRYFNNLRAWKLDVKSAGEVPPVNNAPTAPPVEDDDGDDVPF